MPDYSNGKVYKIVCNITGEQYFGSTTQTLSQRLTQHRSHFKKGRLQCSSSKIIARGNYQIVLCEECPCDNVEQLKSIERKWIEENECVNLCIPNRTQKEWTELHKEEIKEYLKQDKYKNYKAEYYQKNKERLKQKSRENYQTKNKVSN